MKTLFGEMTMADSEPFRGGLFECSSANLGMNRYVQSCSRKSYYAIGSDYWKELANLPASSRVDRVMYDYALVNGLMHYEIQMPVGTDPKCKMQASLH